MVSRSLEDGSLPLVHRTARLAPAGRIILVQRVLQARPISHVTKELGVPRQCARRWIGRDEMARRVGVSPSTAARSVARAGLPAST
ncbi:leucine zipper domain-containing protein [uncultured Schumannella sp.]|uniref:leucine zipper domain-containing protein n=1 Tax=uncultured Schumannella sp. TaxID=1195956 RepID=UPI0034243C6A